MTIAATPKTSRSLGAFEPLRERTFRAIWSSSLLSNFGSLVLGVGAAWEMTRLTNSPGMVALIQTALMLPIMIVAVPAGAIADMFDRRKVALAGLAFAFVCAAALAVIASLGYTSPWLLLGFCTLISSGGALYSPAWQASVREQVKAEHLPAAVALASVSYNIARSFGPALGGVIVLLAGARSAFGINAICYLPLIVAFFLWRRPDTPSRLPPERIDRAIVAGARYAVHSPPIRTVIVRSLGTGMAGASVSALTPIVARDLLYGGAGTYGLLLGMFGGGAVAGALLIPRIRKAMKSENAMRLCALITGGSIVIVGLSHDVILTAVVMAVAGTAWMLMAAILNLGVQLSAPRWVTARALSWYQSSLTGGIAIGAWLWGRVATDHGVGAAMIASGAAMILTPLIGLLMPMPRMLASAIEQIGIAHEPEVALALTARSGPVVVEIDYDVDPDQARQFYDVMRKLQRARKRNGAFEWSIARDIADPALWTERYSCPTWGDYLRQRSRFTLSDLALQKLADGFCRPDGIRRIRRRLERPFGSVRWRADSPDPQSEPIPIFAP
ncbi:MFS transporter [Sphingomonas bacterium]|uniref:MFS transporter n=1 Tax=Sphingomonas bacterium TaxID=1895847 RepID=UPI00157672F9|nr:MFS transporter [Sphingomonas bacterium]